MTLFAQTIVNGLLHGGLYALVALGLTLVFGVMRMINFAHGEFVMLSAYAVYFLFTKLGVSPHWALIPAMAAMAVTGVVLHKLVFQRVLNAPHLNQIVVSFALALILQNAAMLLWTANLKTVKVAYTGMSVSMGPLAFGVSRLGGFLLAVVLSGVLYLLLYSTEIGRVLRAVAQDARTATLMGINVQRAYYIVLALSAALAASAGAICTVTLYVSPYLGFLVILKGFAVVILGGFGNVHGAIVGSALLGCAEALVSTYVSGGAGWAEAVAFAVILLTLVIKPTGLFGSSEA